MSTSLVEKKDRFSFVEHRDERLGTHGCILCQCEEATPARGDLENRMPRTEKRTKWVWLSTLSMLPYAHGSG